MQNNVYFIKPVMYSMLEIGLVNKKLKISYSNETIFRHLRLDHIDQDRIIGLMKEETLSSLKEVYLPQYKYYLRSKNDLRNLLMQQIQRSFTS